MIVPELYVSDLATSLAFYHDVLGFRTRYARPSERFAYLERGAAELMLEEPRGRTWLLGELEHPYGRGINLQITINDVDRLHGAAQKAGARIVLPLEERRYVRASDTIRVRQFVVADPDGYLLRFQQSPAATT